jgi:kumamolisin
MSVSGRNLAPVPGTRTRPLFGSHPNGAVDPADPVRVTMQLARRSLQATEAKLAELAATPPTAREHVTRQEFAGLHGADPDAIDRAREFAAANDLQVTATDAAQRCVTLTAPAEQAAAAFRVRLDAYRHPEAGGYRIADRHARIPAGLVDAVVGVHGLDTVPFTPRPRPGLIKPSGTVISRFAPRELAGLYNFPDNLGAGQRIAIISTGGGYRTADLTAALASIGIGAEFTAEVVSVSVDGATNQPGDPGSTLDDEIVLDVQMALLIAPHARIVVYHCRPNLASFLNAVAAAIHDQVNHATVLSASMGDDEAHWGPGLAVTDSVFSDAALLGVTVCACTGDFGANGTSDTFPGSARVQYPASSPRVLAVGGTKLTLSGAPAKVSETAWNEPGGATGGGVSETFAVPDYQQPLPLPVSLNAGRTGRVIPDVAGHAAGTVLHLSGGQVAPTGKGTSAAAPMWAALMALINERAGRPVGFVNPQLYHAAGSGGVFRDITVGTNAFGGGPGYEAATGFDACTGLGSPDGRAVLRALLPPFLRQVGTPIAETDASRYAYCTSPGGDVLALLYRDAGALGAMRVHRLSEAKAFGSLDVLGNTLLGADDAAQHFTFQVAGPGEDIFCMKTKQTGSGHVEVHRLLGVNGGGLAFAKWVLQIATPITEADAPNFTFAIGAFENPQALDLFCLKRSNTPTGNVEVHVLSQSSNYQKFALQTATPLRIDAAADELVLALRPTSFRHEVWAVHRGLLTKAGPSAGLSMLRATELPGSAPAGPYQTLLAKVPLPIAADDALAHFTFRAGDFRHDQNEHLYALKSTGTGTNSLEVHVINAARF